MKVSDIVPAVLCACFQTSPDCVDSEVLFNKLDILKYVQYLSTTTKMTRQQILVTVANHIEQLGFIGSKGYVLG